MEKNLFTKIILLLVILSGQQTIAQNKNGIGNSLHKIMGNPSSTRFNINNIGTIIFNNGMADFSGSNPAYYYPKLSGKTSVFASGLMWGGYVGDPQDNKLKLGGSSYRTNLSPGKILSNGAAEDTSSAGVRIYRVRKDYKTVTPFQESLDEGKSVQAIYAQYDKDWNEWPANQGAPFEDIDHNGIYNPAIDIPGEQEADQTIWFTANDLDSTLNARFYETTPMGIEIQCTVWGYYEGKISDNMLFKKYLMINKNKDRKTLNNLYVSYWSDADIGGGQYDFNGCDSTLGLFYTYCAVDNNPVYGSNSPATGFVILQGPIVKTNNPQDSAVFKGKHLSGYKNIPMTAHYYKFQPPVEGDPNLNSSLFIQMYYNCFQGKLYDGRPYIDPTTNKPTKFPLAGDPVTHTGWIDGITEPARDVRNGGSCGPFNFAYGDTQEVIIAQISAGATRGVDRLAAVQLLKQYASIAKIYYNALNNLPTDIKKSEILPSEFILYQNYPNPFNPTTKIEYSVPQPAHVKITVYNILGEVVDNLIDEKKQPGNYVLTWNAQNLSSGVYICRIAAASSSNNFIKAIKLLLLK